MAIEKILNTRILNKIDTLENWSASTLPIKKGEICIATVAASAGTGLTEPVVMIKIGEDGVKTFKDLPWNFYAKASDVLTACKSEEGLTAFINEVIAGAGIATDEAMTALAGRVDTAEGKITALEGLVGDTKVSVAIQNAIDALKLSETYAAKVHTHTKADITDFAHTHAMTEVTGLADAIADAKKAGTDAATELGTYKVTNDAAVKANADAIAAINHADTGILAQAKSYADGKDAAIAAAKKAGDDAQAAVDTLAGKVGTVPADKTVVQMISDAQAAATYDDTALAGRVTTAESDIDALEGLVGDKSVSVQIEEKITALNLPTTYEAKGAAAQALTDAKGYADGLNTAMDTRMDAAEGKLTTLIGTDAGKSVRAIANEELVAQLIPETAAASLDTLQEIAAWIQAHPGDASAMNAAIEALETKVGDDTVGAQINAAIEALKIGDYAKAADLTAAVGRITTLEGKSHEHANKALLDTYTQTEANLADAVAKKHEHANKAELDKIADGDKAKWDAAVQTVTPGTGLTATKTGTDVAIGFDDTVTFVFDCGNSTN